MKPWRFFLEPSGYREETTHTFSYSPLSGDDGEAVFMRSKEETDQRDPASGGSRTLRLLGE